MLKKTIALIFATICCALAANAEIPFLKCLRIPDQFSIKITGGAATSDQNSAAEIREYLLFNRTKSEFYFMLQQKPQKNEEVSILLLAKKNGIYYQLDASAPDFINDPHDLSGIKNTTAAISTKPKLFLLHDYFFYTFCTEELTEFITDEFDSTKLTTLSGNIYKYGDTKFTINSDGGIIRQHYVSDNNGLKKIHEECIASNCIKFNNGVLPRYVEFRDHQTGVSCKLSATFDTKLPADSYKFDSIIVPPLTSITDSVKNMSYASPEKVNLVGDKSLEAELDKLLIDNK